MKQSVYKKLLGIWTNMEKYPDIAYSSSSSKLT